MGWRTPNTFLEWLPIDARRRCAVLRFPVEIDLACAPQLRERLLVLLNRGVDGIVADLSGTRFCDSSGLSVLLRARTRADAMGTPFGLVLPENGPVRKVFDMSGVGGLFPVAADVQEAVGLLSPVRSGVDAGGDDAAGGARATPPTWRHQPTRHTAEPTERSP